MGVAPATAMSYRSGYNRGYGTLNPELHPVEPSAPPARPAKGDDATHPLPRDPHTGRFISQPDDK